MLLLLVSVWLLLAKLLIHISEYNALGGSLAEALVLTIKGVCGVVTEEQRVLLLVRTGAVFVIALLLVKDHHLW